MDESLHIQKTFTMVEAFTDSDELTDERSVIIGTEPIYETHHRTIGELFKALRNEHGRCTSKIYIDSSDGAVHVGWCFRKREKYTDSDDTYLCEVWATVMEQTPQRRIDRDGESVVQVWKSKHLN